MVFLLMSSCVPFVFPWASSAHLLALGFLGLFPNFVFPWTFTDFIGLLRPNYFILILGVYKPIINPLLSLLALLWACRGPFVLFFTSYTVHGFATRYFSLSRLFWAHLLFSRPIYLFHGPMIHYSYRLGLMVFVFCLLPISLRSVLLGWASFLSFEFHRKKTLNTQFIYKQFSPKLKVLNLYTVNIVLKLFIKIIPYSHMIQLYIVVALISLFR